MKCETCHKDVTDDASYCPYCGSRLHGAAQPAPFEYSAFISYRHLPRDHEVAKRVQQAIETYRMPKGAFPHADDGRLRKCFRDEDELAASHSLPERILDALSKSSSLVVVCTPHTKDSAWVEREVVAFRQMHGPERVFAVLADGTSAESIPDYLRTSAHVSGGGQAVSSPLAADMRQEAAGKAREEELRLIAAIAGCGFDDLRQRDRARKRRRMALAAAGAIAIVAVVATALAFASLSQRDAIAAESRSLAAESQQLLERGDRYGAIEKALQALPASESSNDRPLLPEARAALEDALKEHSDRDSLWLPSYEIESGAPLGLVDGTLSQEDGVEENAASALAVSDSGGFFALSDSNGKVGTYDLLAGRKLADFPMPENATPLPSGLFMRTMEATEHHLIVSNGGVDNGVLAMFEAETGRLIRSLDGVGVPSLSSYVSSDGSDVISVCTTLSENEYLVTIANLGEDLALSERFGSEAALESASPRFNASGLQPGTNFAAFGGQLFYSDLGSKENRGVALAYPAVASLECIGGLAVVTSVEPAVDEFATRSYAIQAFDENLTLKWSHEGDFSSEMTVANGIQSLIPGEPEIRRLVGSDSDALVSVGREVMILDAHTGEVLNQAAFESTVLDAVAFVNAEDGTRRVDVSCCNGALNSRDFSEGSRDPNGDSSRYVLPFPLRWAHISYRDAYSVLLAIPADATNRIVSFRSDWLIGANDNADITLDELIARAHEVLAEGGRG